MKLSTTTGLCQQSWGTAALRDLNEVLQLLREVGYDTIEEQARLHPAGRRLGEKN